MTTQVGPCSWQSELNLTLQCAEREVEGPIFLDWSERGMGRGNREQDRRNTINKKGEINIDRSKVIGRNAGREYAVYSQ